MLLAENGPVEMPSAIGYFGAAALLIAGGMRELDFQTRFTSSYAFSSGCFLHSSASVLEKLIVAGVLLGLLAAAVLIVVMNTHSFLRQRKDLAKAA